MIAYRQLVKESYAIDALIFYGLPGVTLQALLLQSGVNLDLISDPTLGLFFENAKRGVQRNILFIYSFLLSISLSVCLSVFLSFLFFFRRILRGEPSLCEGKCSAHPRV